MAPIMKASGNSTQPTERVSLLMHRAMCTKATGRTTNPMDTAFTLTKMDPDTRDSGCRTSSMAKEERPGRKEHHTKETMSLAKKKAKANIHGQTDLLTMVIGLTTR